MPTNLLVAREENINLVLQSFVDASEMVCFVVPNGAASKKTKRSCYS